MAILVDSGEQKKAGFAMADLLRTLRSLSNNCGDGVVEDLLTVDGVLIGFNSGCWLFRILLSLFWKSNCKYINMSNI